MKTTKKLRFFVRDIKNLEFQEIQSVLKEKGYRCYRLNITDGSEKLTEQFEKLREKHVIVFIGWQLGRTKGMIKLLEQSQNKEMLSPPGCKIIQQMADKSMLEQVLNLLEISPSFGQRLIMINALRGLEGLKRAMFSRKDMMNIREKEMTARGLTQKDYDQIAEDCLQGVEKNGLFIVETEKAEYRDLVLDHVFWESYGKPKTMDTLIFYRDGYGAEYVGTEVMAYRLFDEFRGLYDCGKAWHSFDAEKDKVTDFISQQYRPE